MTRQQEKLIVLMQNYAAATKYAKIATESSGTAMEKYNAYLDSIEGKMATLSASFEELSMAILSSDLIIGVVEMVTGLVNGISNLAGAVGGLNNLLMVTVGILAGLKLDSIIALIAQIPALLTKIFPTLTGMIMVFRDMRAEGWSTGQAISGAFQSISISANIAKLSIGLLTSAMFAMFAYKDQISEWGNMVIGILALVAAGFAGFCVAVKSGAITTAATVSTAIMSIPIFGWIIAIVEAVIIALAAIHTAVSGWIKTEAEQREAALKTAEAYQAEADALKEVADAADDAADSIRSLVDEMRELQDNGADASDWMEKIQAIGDEVAALYPDEHLTSLQAINRLLDEELSYNDLINMTMQERIGLLDDIEKGTSKVKAQTATEAYRAQKQAGEMLAGALTDYGYEITNEDDLWGNLKGNQIKSAIKEAEEISAQLDNGVFLSGNVGKDIDVNVEAGTLSEYVEKLRAVVDEYEDRYEYNFGALSQNAIYQYLSQSLSEAEASLNSQVSALQAVVESVAEIGGTKLNLEFDETTTREEAEKVYEEAVNALVSEMRSNGDISQALSSNLIKEEDLNEAANEYMRKFYEELYNAAHDMPVFITLKSAIDIFDEIEQEFELLTDAIDEFNESGTVSADTIRSISNEFPELLKYINQTENGFEMLGKTMDEILNDYWESKAKDYADNITAAYEYYEAAKNAYDGTLESYQIVNDAYEELKEAIESGNNFITAQNVLTDSLLEEQYTEILEEQRDALEENADAFAELCDIRKELLKTYADEVKYQKELEKKQRNVAKLQSKLSVARLDASAAGQARVRELEAELQEAQDELEDFTLEHAIDILTEQIEAQNNQYQQLINSSVDRLTAKMDEVGRMTSDAISAAIVEAGKTPVVSGGSVAGGATGSITDAIGGAQQGITGSAGGQLPDKAPIQAPTVYEEPVVTPEVKPEPKKKLEYKTDYSVSGLSGGLSMGKDDISVTIGDHTYDVKVSTDAASDSVSKALDKIYGGDRPDNGRIAPYGGALYITKKGTWRKLVEEDITSLTSKYNKLLNEYHTGGLVGGVSAVSSSEEFAKLLKGEFVSTPAQMERFMKETLPAIANYQSSGASNEFNAPLIEITCESVTSESMPELERVVNEAVKEIKRQLDSGMSRTGYKRSVKTI